MLRGGLMDSKEIKNVRTKLKLTQKDLATKLRVNAITVKRWERGEQRPGALALRRLNRLTRET